MKPGEYARIKGIVADALARPDAERRAYLGTRCGADPVTLAEAESLLAAAVQAAPMFSHPAITVGGLLLTSAPLEDLVPDAAEFRDTPRYAVRHLIGSGGMGVVYAVHDSLRDQVVALKTLRRLDPDSIYQLKREFRNLADVAHPNLVGLHDLCIDDDHCFFTMELVEGDTFVAYVREPGAPREERLRGALPQLVAGVEELHARGIHHRDLKPSNVLVSHGGRVVILDFGLSSPLLAESIDGRELAGTPAYLSPEQCLGLDGSNASDWYSVGATMYEALTGRPPFTGTIREVIRLKTTEDPSHPSVSAADTPADLADLCMGLLQRDPAQRLTGREALRRLTGSDASDAIAEPRRPVFVGRVSSLQTLDGAFADVQGGRSICVAVYGPSGIGKSALVRQFVEGTRRRARVLVLRGRCHERESIPYKGLDGVVDTITQHLSGMAAGERRQVLPEDAGALAALFPVMCALGIERVADRAELDPIRLRRRAFAAFRDLLRRLGARQPLILEIDDFHWADADTVVWITETLRPPLAAAMLTLICFRREELDATPFLRTLIERVDIGERLTLPLGPLSHDEVRELVDGTMPPDRRPATVADIVRDSGGNAFLVEALIRHAASGAGASLGATLVEMLTHRLRGLPPEAAAFLSALSLCGRAVRAARVYEACGFTGDDRLLIARLRAEHLVRDSRSPGSIEVFHDRIREALAERVPADAAREMHALMARVLVAHGDDEPEALFEHYAAAGDNERAAAAAASAAAKAASVLAFELAVSFYRQALALHPEAPQRADWMRNLGAALEHTGRPVEAADAYLTAADQGPPAERLTWQRKAAELLLIGGQIDRGLDVSRRVLDTVGMRLARGPRTALASLLVRRLQLWRRGVAFVPRDQSEIRREDLLCIDAAWAVSAGLAMVEPIRAAAFNVRHLLRALAVGEPFRIARAMALEAGFSAVGIGAGRHRAGQFSRQAQTVALRGHHHYVASLTTLWEGIAAFLAGEWKPATGLCGRAAAALREEQDGVIWELNLAHNFFVGGLVAQGELREASRHLPPLLASARERGNFYLELELDTRMILVWLAADDADGAERRGREGIARWSQRGFHRQHYSHALMRVQVALYRGRGREAWRLIEECQRPLRRSLFLRVQHTRIERANYRARCALAVAGGGVETHRMRAVATREAGRLRRERRPWADAFADLLLATVAGQQGETVAARARLTSAIARFDGAGMQLYAAVARRCLGSLIGGEAGAKVQEDAAAWMRSQEIRDVAAMTQLIAPGFPIRAAENERGLPGDRTRPRNQHA
jgi:hypothetical protein